MGHDRVSPVRPAAEQTAGAVGDGTLVRRACMAPLSTRFRVVRPCALRIVGHGLLMLLVLGAGAVDARAAFDPLGVNAAAREVRDAVGLMDAAAAQLPAEAQQAMAAELQLLGRSIDWTLNRVEDQAVPLVERAVLHDLNFVADAVASVSDELRQIDGAPVEQAVRARIDELSSAISARLERISAMTDRWMERTRTAMVELDAEAGAIVVKQIDRAVYEGVRYASIALLLTGLLAIGLRLLRMSEAHLRFSGLLKQNPVVSSLALGLLGAFFLGCAVLSLWPGALADVSAQVEVHAQEHPCQRLDAQQEQLAAAQELQLESLVDATKVRMREAARDCLGLPAGAAAEAVEQLAAKLVPVDEQDPAAPSGLADRAVAALEPEQAGVTMGAPQPPLRSTDEVLAPLFSAVAQEPAAGPRDDAATELPAAPSPPAIIEPPALPPAAPAAEQPEAEQTAAREPAPQPREPASSVAVPASTRPPIVLSDLLPPEPEVEEFITTAGVNYRTAPTVDAPRLGALPAGTRVRVVSERAGWAEIELNDGRQAFMAVDYLQPAPAPN